MALSELGWSQSQYEYMKKLYDEYMSGSDQLVSLMHQSWEFLISNGGGYVSAMCSDQVGCSPSSRDGEGLLVDRVQSVPVKVTKASFTFSACDNDSYAEEDHPITKHCGKFTEAFTSMNEMFAKYKSANVKLGSLGASHLHHSLEAARQGVPCSEPSISENGRMSKSLLEASDEANTKGF